MSVFVKIGCAIIFFIASIGLVLTIELLIDYFNFGKELDKIKKKYNIGRKKQ